MTASPTSDVHYIQMPLGAWPTDLARLLAGVPWAHRVEARAEAFMAAQPLRYTYGQGPGERTYIAGPLCAGVDQVLTVANGMLACLVGPTWGRLNGAFLNRYDGERNQLGWHADDAPEMDPTAPIAVVSFGAVRMIEWKLREGGEVHRQELVDGSLFVMPPGFQSAHLHRIPKAGYRCGPRVSITLRRFLESA